MDRALRRHQQMVAKVRWRNIVIQHNGWRWVVEKDPKWPRFDCKIWKRDNFMSESGHKWWRKLMMTRPDRSVEHQALHLVERGVDADQLYWPTHRDYWLYYW